MVANLFAASSFERNPCQLILIIDLFANLQVTTPDPSEGGEYSPPKEASPYSPHSDVSSYSPPSDASSYSPPSEGYSYSPPSEGLGVVSEELKAVFVVGFLLR
jgi:hypothetical protein